MCHQALLILKYFKQQRFFPGLIDVEGGGLGETSFGSIHGGVGGLGADGRWGAGIGHSTAIHRAKGIPL